MSFFKSETCCSSRQPPSPEGLAPRVISQVLTAPKVARDPVTSWTQAETAELRAIFEEDGKDAEAEILQVKHNSAHKLKEILLADESDSDHLSMRLNIRKSNTNTLVAVTQKLKKHLSGDFAIKKRHSKSSVGTSEEEIERRAELRRIRTKRIQEELSNEGLYDEDAKSLTSVADANIAKNNKSRSSWTPGDALSPPSLTPPHLDSSAASSPGLPSLHRCPKNVILEDEVTSSGGTWKQGSRQHSLPNESSVTLVNSSSTISRRHSSPILNDWDSPVSNPPVYAPGRKRSSLPPIPPQPTIEAQRCPSIPEPSITELSRSSWRLSFTANNRGEVLRKLSQEHTEPLPVTMEHFGVSPLLPTRNWLHNQGLRSTSQVLTSSEDDSTTGTPIAHAELCTINHDQDFGGVDGGAEANAATLHLHEMGIPSRLASRGLQSSTSSPQLSSWGSHDRGASSSGAESRIFRTERARLIQRSSDSAPLSARIPQSWGTVLQDGTSSYYPSAGNSMEPSPQSSRFNLASLLSVSRSKVDVVDVKKPPVTSAITGLTAPPSVNDSKVDLAPPPTRQSRRTTLDDSSLIASETESFRQREAELSIIPKRFASSESRLPGTPKSSRFREEFDVETPPAPTSPTRRPSRFSKLKKRLTLGGSFDGPKDMEDLLSIPVPKFAPKELYHSGTSTLGSGTPLLSPGMASPGSGDPAVGLWGMAVKSQGQRKASEIGHNMKLPPGPRKKSSQVSRKKSAVEEELHGKVGATSVFGQLTRNLSWGPKKKKADINDHESAAAEYQKKFQQRVEAKEMVMDSWEMEMAATAAKAKSKSKNIVKKAKPTGPDRRYPATWSRYPSHDRHERSISATREDKVESTDFAVAKINEKGEAVWYHSEKKHHAYHHDEDEHLSHDEDHRKHLKQRIGERKGRAEEKIKYKKYKLNKLTEQGTSGHAKGRRSSLTMAGQVEFPELEILPVTLRTREQQEKEVHEEQQQEIREKRQKFTLATVVDGSGEEVLDIGINDPRFYDDCIVSAEDMILSAKKQKYRTWSGRDWDVYSNGSESTRRGRTLRRSTDEYVHELQMLEVEERKKALLAAERAWEKTKRGSF
ncbi:hypothetical protein LSUE1_G009805 [Lachnellula suecica]|uniref:Uncharacterized protein n=1 Tax=Lachnellula suecica TaxID=602035 RepID=A0A8T9C1N3_9HELO|nr:hypothetical protein LSUE1_G009805 [Lachnellula suecica]